MYTMGDIARCSLGGAREFHNEELLYRLSGINAELLICHAWGWEPVTMEQIKAYRPQVNSISSGQVLHCPYDAKGARLVVQEMADALALDLVERHLVTDQLVLTVGYDIENITNPALYADYRGEIVADRYGRKIPKHAHGTVNLKTRTSSSRKIMEAVMGLYDDIVNPKASRAENHACGQPAGGRSPRRGGRTIRTTGAFYRYRRDRKRRKNRKNCG